MRSVPRPRVSLRLTHEVGIGISTRASAAVTCVALALGPSLRFAATFRPGLYGHPRGDGFEHNRRWLEFHMRRINKRKANLLCEDRRLVKRKPAKHNLGRQRHSGVK